MEQLYRLARWESGCWVVVASPGSRRNVLDAFYYSSEGSPNIYGVIPDGGWEVGTFLDPITLTPVER
jgi:hypothetical protein